MSRRSSPVLVLLIISFTAAAMTGHLQVAVVFVAIEVASVAWLLYPLPGRRSCPECSSDVKVGVLICPQCGYSFVGQGPPGTGVVSVMMEGGGEHGKDLGKTTVIMEQVAHLCYYR